MTTLLDLFAVNNEVKTISEKYDNNTCINYSHCRHVLKSKENIFNLKCKKALKRKLKKYKLRRDGREDQDVTDVSQILLSSLKIKSPNNQKHLDSIKNNTRESEEFRPKNYLFKMATRKISKNVAIENHGNLNNCEKNKNLDIKMPQNNGVDEDSTLTHREVKKQKDAFKLMMDSRNKSIGNNSPGKEKIVDEADMQEIIEKKKIKAKRSLMLQKMAEAKGSLQRKEIEECQEEYIKIKMKKRADRLKNMITMDPKIQTNKSKEPLCSISYKGEHKALSVYSDNIKIDNNDINSHINTYCENSVSLEVKTIIKEDDEFLNKLSPSIRKKENMLTYFKKVEKESECFTFLTDNGSDNNSQIIKVKMTPRKKKKGKKKKLSLEKTEATVMSNNSSKNNSNDLETNSLTNFIEVTCKSSQSDKRKRKHYENDKGNLSGNSIVNIDLTEANNTDSGKPKRNIQRPVKYIDGEQLSSSDEEYHIFTPKKKKHIDKSKVNNSNQKTKLVTNDQIKKNSLDSCKKTRVMGSDKEIKGKSSQLKKTTKLAPIFTVKSQVTPEATEAKQKFLHSGIPEQLKKTVQQNDKSTVSNTFPIVVHIQQIENTVTTTKTTINLHEPNEDIYVESRENVLKNMLCLDKINNIKKMSSTQKLNINTLLQTIKQMYPKFPVYRIYRLLNDKRKGEFKDCNYSDLDNSIEVINGMIDIKNEYPGTLDWTSKYKAMSSNQIIGNFESIRDLKKWLLTWTENEMSSKNNIVSGSDSSDFCQSDPDSSDSVKNMNNLLILTGPTGSGKTSSIYAVASELAIKVIEVNCSSKRTGKTILQDLQEATQSHNVNRGKGSSTESSQKSQEITNDIPKRNIKKRGRPKKTKGCSLKASMLQSKNEVLSQSSQESQVKSRTAMSLILIDDADIVFDQDDGFCSAIAQLVQCSKRPLILVTSSLSCLHLQRFVQYAKIIKMNPLSPRMLGTWLDILCLANKNYCWPGTGAKFLDYFKGDIRKTINCLQFYMSDYTQDISLEQESSTSNSNDYKTYIDDECSSMSWADREGLEVRNSIPSIVLEDSVWKEFMDKESQLVNPTYPIKLFDLWWSLPYYLNSACIQDCSTHDQAKKSKDIQSNLNEVNAIANVIDYMSLADYLTHSRQDVTTNITSQPWHSSENDNVCENEHLNNYNKSYEITDEISHILLSSITYTQKILDCETKTDALYPSMAQQRERDRIVSRHNELTTYLNPAAVLDRKALALDYWSFSRTICRIEKTKTDGYTKRHNRFCHYLKSLKVMCKSESFDYLSDSLCSTNRNNDLLLQIPNPH